MSGRKTGITVLLAVMTLGGSFAHAEHLPATAEARLALFAQCAGRFSAEMEHAWLFGRDGHVAQSGRAQMVSLIDALRPAAGVSGRAVLAMRIEAKHAHAALLARGRFEEDAQARRLSRRYTAHCAALLPVSLELAALR